MRSVGQLENYDEVCVTQEITENLNEKQFEISNSKNKLRPKKKTGILFKVAMTISGMRKTHPIYFTDMGYVRGFETTVRKLFLAEHGFAPGRTTIFEARDFEAESINLLPESPPVLDKLGEDFIAHLRSILARAEGAKYKVVIFSLILCITALMDYITAS